MRLSYALIVIFGLSTSCERIVENTEQASIFLGILTALVTITGWFVTEHIKNTNNSNRSKIDQQAKYLERQIEQFYGPLFNLVNQIITCNHVLYQINNSKHRSPEDKQIIVNFFHEQYFLPLHKEFNGILKSKLYLIEGSSLPDSFYNYLRHAIQEQAQLSLWNNHKIDTSDVHGIPYPNELYKDIKGGLDLNMEKYANLIFLIEQQTSKMTRLSKQ